ncbi:branched-chain amino acid--2-keto-4-methylthiobutyrate aminotransferase [Pseudomonas sp. ADAK2]|uniref:aminotransferase class IV n=1 Tax=unclassified Pseudomonas TaxID=196821 RepID=UPI0014630B0E|nr:MULTISPECIES: aminotransferase class IV [unclassified Pseudomonas]QJI40143.1 branched-chain amino acid--2-keto-4-methylthiobutyrate aminotransferase [Pseudomonas sp. ADAK7]QJI46448.1 branched-chain amino acid--2-keto-4-methylthiobutyrate aminotransferase [Pseudomonas sp. ADAK2]
MSIIQAQHIMLNDPAHARAAFDPKYSYGSAFTNGIYVDLDHATVPLSDLGFTQADAVYDVVSVSKGWLFRLEDHLERFEKGCAKFYLRNPYTKTQTIDILTTLVKQAGTKEAYVWWAVTRGKPQDSARRKNPDNYESRFYAFVVPYVFICPDEQRTRGIDLMVSQKYLRIPPESVDPTAKNFHWMDLKLSLFEAGRNKSDWSVLCDAKDNLTEAPGSNIFLIKDGELFTPDSGCLEGITRKTALELAAQIGMPIHVEKVHVEQLRNADEAFLTSTAGGIMPVNSVDGKVLGGKAGPGELTTTLHNLYWTKRWDGWLGTPVDYSHPA